MDRVADLAPAEEGVNVTVTVCAGPPELTVNEVGDTVNCVESAPVRPMNETDSAASPAFPTVKVRDLLCPTCASPKLREVEDRETAGASPVPVNATVDGLPAAL
jgi:hypothetical protein